MTNRKLHNALSIDTKIDDLAWPWTLGLNFQRINWDFATTAKRMKIDQYCQRQRCSHEQFLACFRVARVCRRQLGFLVSIQEAKLWLGEPTVLPHSSCFAILGCQHIGVTSLTFRGHVTSSDTRPLDSPQAISYWLFFGTKLLSLTDSEIFNGMANMWRNCLRDLKRPLNKGQGHSFWYQSILIYD